MEYRRLGKTGRDVSVIGFGAWAIGADWGAVDDADSLRALHAAADAGVNLIDTADVYGDGRSERVIRRFLAERAGETFFVATKMGRRAPLDMASYTPEAFRAWTDRSRENLGVETLDLVQLHCLHPSIYYSPEHFAALDELVAAGAIAAYGVSVEKVEEAPQGHRVPGRRHGPDHLQHVPPAARGPVPRRGGAPGRGRPRAGAARVGPADRQAHGRHDVRGRRTIACTTATASRSTWARRSPAWTTRRASRWSRSSRRWSRRAPPWPRLALRWILMHDGITTTIPGAKTPEQARANAAAADLAPLPPETMARVAELYETRIKPQVHQRW